MSVVPGSCLGGFSDILTFEQWELLEQLAADGLHSGEQLRYIIRGIVEVAHRWSC